MELTGFDLFKRRFIKRILYAAISTIQNVLVILGKMKPVIRFIVAKDPPSVYYNFRVRPDRLYALEKHIHLPSGFSLTPLRYLENDNEPTYCMTLNAYRVSGATGGYRTEWSAYVKDPEGRTRYMCVEARTTGKDLEPPGSITPNTYLKHSNKEGTITTKTKTSDGLNFKSSFPIPREGDTPLAYASREWVAANDEIYWRTGVYDRAFYNRHFACAKMYIVPPESVTIEDSTQWSPYLEPVPELVAVFTEGIEFLIVPWSNL